MGDPLLLTAAQAARFLGIGTDKLRRLAAKGVIPSWTDPDTKHRHYSRPVLERWAAAAENTPTPRTRRKAS